MKFNIVDLKQTIIEFAQGLGEFASFSRTQFGTSFHQDCTLSTDKGRENEVVIKSNEHGFFQLDLNAIVKYKFHKKRPKLTLFFEGGVVFIIEENE